MLGGATGELHWAKNPPTVIMLAGLQGAGKTTLAGKLAKWMKSEGHTPLLVAADLQRPNAVTQLQVVGERAGCPVFAPEPGNGVGDPVLVAMNGVSNAQFQQHDVVIVDTAGRLGIDEEMMEQARNIRDAVNPHETLFVVDAMIGQDAARVAEAFRDGVGFTGVVLSSSTATPAAVRRSRSPASPSVRSCSPPPARASTSSSASTRTAWRTASSTWVTSSP